MTHISVVFHSNGEHTTQLAHAVHRGAARVSGVVADLWRIAPAQIDARGRRHDAAIAQALAQADGIVFGCPTLMGMVSAPFKAFMEGAFLGPMSQALADVEVQRSIPPSDLLTGERYGERLARIVRRRKGEGEYTTPRHRDAATAAAPRAAAAA